MTFYFKTESERWGGGGVSVTEADKDAGGRPLGSAGVNNRSGRGDSVHM